MCGIKAMRVSFLVVTMVNVCLTTTSLAYELSDQNLTAVPYDIPDNVTELFLSRNKIQNTDALAQRDLPDLLRLYLNDNELQSFPDMTLLGDTLEIFSLENNKISFISTASILPLKALETLSIFGNPVTSLPNFGLLPSSPVLTVVVVGLSFVCDWRMALVKKPQASGKVSLVPDPQCNAPSHLDGLALSAVTEADMMAQANVTASYGKYVPIDATQPMAFYPNINKTVNDVTSSQCARMCLDLPGCSLFAFNSGSCSLTDLQTGSAGPISSLVNCFARV